MWGIFWVVCTENFYHFKYMYGKSRENCHLKPHSSIVNCKKCRLSYLYKKKSYHYEWVSNETSPIIYRKILKRMRIILGCFGLMLLHTDNFTKFKHKTLSLNIYCIILLTFQWTAFIGFINLLIQTLKLREYKINLSPTHLGYVLAHSVGDD